MFIRISPRALLSALFALFALFACASASAAPILWIADSSGRLGRVDVANGNVTVVGTMSPIMYDIAFDPSGRLYGITSTGLYSINTATAVATLVGNHNTSTNSLVFGANGWAFAASGSLYEINSYNGVAINVGNGGSTYQSSGDLAFVGSQLYLSSGLPSPGDKLIRLNTATGQGTVIGGIGYASVFGLASPDNVTLYGVAGTKIIRIDTTTGTGSFIVDYGGHGLSSANGTAFYEEASGQPCGPDISVQKTRDGHTFLLSTINTGTPISGPAKIELIDLLPAGLNVVSYGSAPGWTCVPAAPVNGPDAITCTYSIPSGTTIATGQSFPGIPLVTTGTGDCPNCVRGRLYQYGSSPPPPSPPTTPQWQIVTETNTANNVSCVQ